jgi:hypothetical protein
MKERRRKRNFSRWCFKRKWGEEGKRKDIKTKWYCTCMGKKKEKKVLPSLALWIFVSY